MAAPADLTPDQGDEIQLAARAQIGKSSLVDFQVAARTLLPGGGLTTPEATVLLAAKANMVGAGHTAEEVYLLNHVT